MPKYDFGPTRRRRSPVGMILLLLLVALIGFLAYLGFSDSEVPVAKIEQDVTNEIQAR